MSEFEITIDLSDDDDLETEETIRVLWASNMKMHHLSICANHPLEKLFAEISKLYSIPFEFVEMRYKDEPVSPLDTLDSLGFRVVHDCLYASKATQAAIPTSQSLFEPGKNKLHIKCLVKDRKKPLDVYLNPRQNLHPLLEALSEELSVSSGRLKIKFDGDVLNAKDTPQSLDLEGGECFDVFISK